MRYPRVDVHARAASRVLIHRREVVLDAAQPADERSDTMRPRADRLDRTEPLLRQIDRSAARDVPCSRTRTPET